MSDPAITRQIANLEFAIEKLEYNRTYILAIVKRVEDGTIEQFLEDGRKRITDLKMDLVVRKLEQLTGE